MLTGMMSVTLMLSSEEIKMNNVHRFAICLVGLAAVLCGDGICSTVTINTLDNCQGHYYDRIGSYSASSGNTFLVVGLKIRYNGEGKFSVDPSFFNASINKVDYNNSVATYSLGDVGLNPLPTKSLRNGSSVQGYISYEVPASQNDFRIIYEGFDNIKIINNCVRSK